MKGFVVAVTEAGGSAFKSRGSLQLASPDAVLVFNPVEPHSGRTVHDTTWRYRGFYFDVTGLASLQTQRGVRSDPGFIDFDRLIRP
nr:AraC family ligand binding domain-containing protein [Rhodoferax sp.]